jgi:hypothetical protein
MAIAATDPAPLSSFYKWGLYQQAILSISANTV